MTRVRVVVEGQSEESFISLVLAPVLSHRHVYLTPIILGSPGHKGGNTSYARVKKDIVLLFKQDQAAYCSTMLDLYGLGPGFPGTSTATNITNHEKVSRIERAVKEDIVASVPDSLRPEIRFIPYLQLHEYEALLFSDPKAFASSIRQPKLVEKFEAIRKGFPMPEDINDDPNSAPSKRVLGLYPQYSKVLDGTQAAREVGIAKMRQECPHFRRWVEKIEALTTE